MTKKFLIAASLIATLFTISCKKEPAAPVNEEEQINHLELILRTAGTNIYDTFIFNDPDGIGGIAASVDSIIIDKDSVFIAQLILKNTIANPEEIINEEIETEASAHQFFYTSSPTTLLRNFSYLDTDTNDKPLGLKFQFDARGSSYTGNLKITLRHEPNKSATGVDTGDITNADGETDIEVNFPVRLY
ncbi:MAG: hypothetical protein U0U67_00040 [Chitinophagales bacterium]